VTERDDESSNTGVTKKNESHVISVNLPSSVERGRLDRLVRVVSRRRWSSGPLRGGR